MRCVDRGYVLQKGPTSLLIKTDIPLVFLFLFPVVFLSLKSQSLDVDSVACTALGDGEE